MRRKRGPGVGYLAPRTHRCPAGAKPGRPVPFHGAARGTRGPPGTGLGNCPWGGPAPGSRMAPAAAASARAPGGPGGVGGEPPRSPAAGHPGAPRRGRRHVLAAHRGAVRAGLLRRSPRGRGRDPRQGSPSGGGAAGRVRRGRRRPPAGLRGAGLAGGRRGSARGPGRAWPRRCAGSPRPGRLAAAGARSPSGAGPRGGAWRGELRPHPEQKAQGVLVTSRGTFRCFLISFLRVDQLSSFSA